MIYKTVELANEYALKGGTLECICLAMPYDVPTVWKRPAVIVVPGGGYAMCSEREANVVAMAFMARGFQTFVLRYSTAPDGVAYPEQLLELAAAFDYVRKNAAALAVKANEVFAVGFSAGGHLVGNLSCSYALVEGLYGKALDCKPTAVGLSYPVIYYEGHRGSFKNLTAALPEEERERMINALSLDKLVTKDTSPAFIWSTFEDQMVSCENSLRYALALKKAGVQFALHIYPVGLHGLSVCSYEISKQYGDEACDAAKGWVDECCKFFRMYTQEKY